MEEESEALEACAAVDVEVADYLRTLADADLAADLAWFRSHPLRRFRLRESLRGGGIRELRDACACLQNRTGDALPNSC